MNSQSQITLWANKNSDPAILIDY